MIIAIEGVDGVGKSTVSSLVSRRLGYEFVEKPLSLLLNGIYADASKYVNEQSQLNMRAWFYGLGNVYFSSISADKNVITDRYLLSNYAWNFDDGNKALFDILVDQVKLPDWTFLLTAKLSIIQERIIKRGHSDKDLSKLDMFDKQCRRMKECLDAYCFPHSIIDTSNITASEVSASIIATLNKTLGIEAIA